MNIVINGIEITLNDEQVKQLVHRELTKPAVETRARIEGETGLFIPPIGKYWEGQGGVNHGLMMGADGKPYWLIAADYDFESDWGKADVDVSKFSPLDGRANTALMLLAELSTAKAVTDFTADGHKDFYIGSQREMHLCYANKDGSWRDKWYWTSTPYGSGGAWIQCFGGGSSYLYTRSGKGFVRPVRSVIL